ncbi:MAG TPA: hypothetical protein VNQ56_15610 [Pseudolabrys sp.]|nr:hypothetical protein [Pseudolabrys sp.]
MITPRHTGALRRLRATGEPLVFAVLITSLSADAANAHVKWFCAFDVAGQPRGLENVLCLDFELLTAAAIFFLLTGCFLEGTPLGIALLKGLDRATTGLRTNTDLIIRGICGFFFVALWTFGGIILTPELKTSSALIPWLQLAIATGLLWRKTLPLSGAGIIVLFAIGVWNYGAFHLADYPIFLTVAVYLILVGLGRNLFGVRPVDIIRYGAAVTLMWASIEKWAYPEWSFPLFISHPSLSLGFDAEFYMRAAGVIEFTLAFALLWTPLVRRCAAIILTGMFISACFEFGKIDVIGHSAIIAVLLAIIADDHVLIRERRAPLLLPPAFAAALAGFLFVYYAGHAFLYNTTIL